MKKENKEEEIPDEDKSAPEGVHQGDASSSSSPSDTPTGTSEGKEETSELEDEIKKTERALDENKFREFVAQSSTEIPPTESFSPVLEKTETPRQRIDLEQGVASTQLRIGEAEDNEQIKYSPTKNSEGYTPKSERDEENYTESGKIDENFPIGQPAQINVETAGRDLHPQLREVSPINLESHELRKPQGTLETKYVQPESIDMEKVGRERQGKSKNIK